ncbi:bifunctional phosphopantothenoylcysteine decarboxylase/phosphopantothenate synthase [Pseudomonas aeruginosa]
MQRLYRKRIVLGVGGGIAAYKSAELVRRLRDQGAEVRVVMTQGGREFITPLTLQALSGHPVHTDLLDPAAEAAMGHIELARWADLVLIAPATADLMARLVQGVANDLLTTLVLATDAQIALAPAMNQAMWRDTATQANAELLRQRGFHLFGPAAGSQACGDVGLMPCDLLIASAAVADYRPEVVAAHKLKKDPTSGEGLLLQLVRNPDILATLAQREDRPFSVGFAAETENLLDYAARKLKDKNLDLIVANDVANPSIGFNSDENAITVIDRDLHPSTFAQTSKGKIARQLVAFIADRLNQQ